MKLPIIGFTTLLMATLAMTSVVYADEQDDKQAIMQAYRNFDAAYGRKDINQAYTDHAPEFTSIGLDGKLTNLEQVRQGAQQFWQNARQFNLHNEVEQLKINGQTATVTGAVYASVIFSNPKNPQVPVPYSSVGQFQEIWKRTPGGWKLISTHILNQNVAVGQQSSQANRRRKLTPAQEQIEIMRYQQMMRFNNNATCMASGFSCGF